MVTKKQIQSAVMGSVIGDAIGVPYEFSSLGDMKKNPCIDMVGYGTHQQPSGTWSDDSSMLLATMDSLSQGLDYDDMIQRYVRWIRDGEYTQYGEVFDYGGTTYKALQRYPLYDALECGLTTERSNGNGSLMRIIPACLYVNNKDIDEQIDIVGKVSQLTHGHKESKASCNIYNFVVQEILNNPKKKLRTNIEEGISNSGEYYNNKNYKCFNRLYNNLLDTDTVERIHSSGYVVESLEVALYYSYHTKNYKESILTSVNTGEDTDTNACICGGLTGLYYGCSDIPDEWIKGILKRDYVLKLCDKFHKSLKE